MKIFTFKSIATATTVIASVFAMNPVEVFAQEGSETVQTDALYIMGSATSVGFNLDNPIALTRTSDDIFSFKGELTPGEIKLTTQPGSWESPFIRPLVDQSIIWTSPIVNEKFQVTTGANQKDFKWQVTSLGIYTLTFNLGDNTMSSIYDGEVPAPEKGAVKPDNVYLLGAAFPAGWNIDDPTTMQKISDYKFLYEGPLTTGELKFCMEKGNWLSACIPPVTNGKSDKHRNRLCA